MATDIKSSELKKETMGAKVIDAQEYRIGRPQRRRLHNEKEPGHNIIAFIKRPPVQTFVEPASDFVERIMNQATSLAAAKAQRDREEDFIPKI